jgi:tellurite resistance protein TerC
MHLVTVGSPLLWIGFVAMVVVLLVVDLGLFHRKAHVVAPREALCWTAVWITLAFAFNGFVWWRFGGDAATEFLTGYVIEKSLSVDNLFVFLVIFRAMAVPREHQHRVLFWGIVAALILRAIMIVAGAALLARFHWLMYLFGGFLVFTGIKLYLERESTPHPEKSRVYAWIRRIVPATPRYDGQHFFTIENGRRLATPLFLTLLLVEVCDVIFAVDSIPAIFAVTSDPFIVFTSNIFAILGLRSLFFLLASLVEKFVHLKVGLAAVLVFVGAKMLLVDVIKLPPWVSLGVVAALLGGAVLVSWFQVRHDAGSAPG